MSLTIDKEQTLNLIIDFYLLLNEQSKNPEISLSNFIRENKKYFIKFGILILREHFIKHHILRWDLFENCGIIPKDIKIELDNKNYITFLHLLSKKYFNELLEIYDFNLAQVILDLIEEDITSKNIVFIDQLIHTTHHTGTIYPFLFQFEPSKELNKFDIALILKNYNIEKLINLKNNIFNFKIKVNNKYFENNYYPIYYKLNYLFNDFLINPYTFHNKIQKIIKENNLENQLCYDNIEKVDLNLIIRNI